MNGTAAYILKIRGVNRLPDQIQVRDADFTLIAYFRADKPGTDLPEPLCHWSEDELKQRLGRLNCGRLTLLSNLV